MINANKVLGNILGSRIKTNGKSKNKLSKNEENTIESLERAKDNIVNSMGDYDTTYNPATARTLDKIDDELNKLYSKKRRIRVRLV